MKLCSSSLMLFVVLVGCGKSSSSSTEATASSRTAAVAATTPSAASANDNDALFTCYSKEEGLCMRFDDLALGEINDTRKSCAEPGEKFSMDACPTQGLLGTCTEKAKGDEPAMTTFFYKSESLSTAADAKDFCKGLPGVFALASSKNP